MLFRSLVTLLLSVAVLSSFAQTGKMPAMGGIFEQEPPNQEVLKKKYTGFTELTLAANSSYQLDTTSVFKAMYNPQGLLTDTWLYEYGEERRQSPPAQHLSQRIKEATHFIYQYDGKGNRIEEKKYDILPADSYASYMYLFRQETAKKRMQKMMNANGANEENDAADKELKAYNDSLLRVGAPEQSILTGLKSFVYDVNNNVVYEQDSEAHNRSSYTYTFYADGRVHTQHQSYVSHGNAGSPYHSTQELHFTFTPKGEMTSATRYSTERESLKVAGKENIILDQKIHYNVAGLKDTVEFGSIKGNEGTKHVLTYKDSLLQTVTIYRTPRKNTSYDTMSHTIYKYGRNGLCTAVLTIRNYSLSNMRKGKDTGREEYSYNNKGVIIERKLYGTRYGQSGQLKEQHLFFYGNADDKKTQQRIIAMIAKPAEKEDPNGIDPGLLEMPPPPVSVQPPTSDTVVFAYVEQMPAFNGDITKYLNEHLRYPEDARKNGVEGQVVVRFVVRANGTIGRVEVLRGLGHGCDEEALRLIKGMPAWKPGRQNGKAVDVYFTTQVYFKL